MLFITDNEFERVVSRARNRIISKEYYKKECVIYVSITKDHRNFYHISGKVMVNGNVYLPRVLVNEDSKIVSTDCNCIYADEYTACGHIGALILKVQELSPNTFPFKYAVDLKKRAMEEKRNAEKQRLLWEQQIMEARRKEREKESVDLTDYIKSQLVNQFTPMDTTPVHLKAFADGWHFSMNFKIGRNRLYIIKNIPQFMTYMTNNEYHSYGKALDFVHDPELLDENSLKLYQFIQKYYHTHLSNSTNILINNANIDALWDLVNTIPHSMHPFQFEDGNFRPVVEVTKDEHDTIFELKSDLYLYYAGKNDLYTYDHSDHLITRFPFDKQWSYYIVLIVYSVFMFLMNN